VYWILTPQLPAPVPIYCDQVTDGGGWALVGRGRENWSYAYDGVGSADDVARTITGPEAFKPKQLGGDTITALFGGKELTDPTYSDAIRLRRAATADGSAWHETRMYLATQPGARWTWSFGAGIPLSGFKFGDRTTTGARTTYNFNTDNGLNYLWTYESSSNNYVRGFNYGGDIRGTTSDSTYLFSSETYGRWPSPFTQVYVRPKIRSTDISFKAIEDQGTKASTIRAVPRNGSLPSPWGVTGIGAGGTSENASEVQAFAQVGNTMFVGGNFTTVQKGADATGDDVVAQPYLAAFDARTGEFIRSFTPQFNNQIKALESIGNGRVAVGGEFTTVNGEQRAGLVVLDASTGQIDPQWTTNLVNKVSNRVVSVRGLDSDGTNLYVTGAFTHFVSPNGQERYAKNGARLSVATGLADRNWNPEFNGTGTALDISEDGKTVYFAGYFTTARGGVKADRAAAFGTADGAPMATPAWQPTFSTSGSARYQQAIGQMGSKVWLGGSQHSMFSYNTSTFALENSHITKAGGDIQAITTGNGLVFAGCHCENWNYSGTTNYDSLSAASTSVKFQNADKIYYAMAYDPTTGDLAKEWTPEMRARLGRGVWALEVDNDGVLWAGGTLTRAVQENGKTTWLGGFVRYAPRPNVAPERPTSLDVELRGSTATVSFKASSSNSVRYEVLRNDRVVASTDSRSVTVEGSRETDRFFVRAVDSWGNRSESTSVQVPVVKLPTTTLLSQGQPWRYRFDNAPVDAKWATREFDDSAWAQGTAPLGFGSASIATSIDVPQGQTRPVVSYFRSSFTIEPGSTVGKVTLTTRADDAVAVHVNGHEIGRANLPDGTLSASMYALSAPRTSSAAPVTFEIPQEALVAGTNVVAIEVHSMYRSTPDSSMDAQVEMEAGTFEPLAPAVTTPLVKAGEQWSFWQDSTVDAPADWMTSSQPPSNWAQGQAPIGWGSTTNATNVDLAPGQTRPLAWYARRTFTVDADTPMRTLTLITRADDGVAVYINGVEVGRSNLPEGELTARTYAETAVSTANAINNPVTFDVPVSLLQQGENTIAVRVHSNYRSTPNSSMDLTLTAKS
jgi:hypothetical protein